MTRIHEVRSWLGSLPCLPSISSNTLRAPLYLPQQYVQWFELMRQFAVNLSEGGGDSRVAGERIRAASAPAAASGIAVASSGRHAPFRDSQPAGGRRMRAARGGAAGEGPCLSHHHHAAAAAILEGSRPSRAHGPVEPTRAKTEETPNESRCLVGP